MGGILAGDLIQPGMLRAAPQRALIRFRVLREGAVTNNVKRIRVLRGWDTGSKLDLAADTRADTAHEFTGWIDVALQTLLDQPRWVVIGVDDSNPPLTSATYMVLTPADTAVLNINTGEGGSTPTDPATVGAVVRVDGGLASREVVALEKDSAGQWRVAGHGASSEGGAVDLSLGVTGGAVYVFGLDDYGTPFTPSVMVAVGHRVRPSFYSGWLYEITEPGTLPTTEPQWWAAEGDNAPRLLGTARAIAVRYYQPLAHGPVPVEII